jgi:hypothetical protein
MPDIRTNLNERSWAIELISDINAYAQVRRRAIRKATWEMTINTGKQRLFPDVLLHGESSEILMWWELKLPDTPINDIEFIDNAKSKAKLLGLDAFLLWNANIAKLYIKNSEWNFLPEKTWDSLSSRLVQRSDLPDFREEIKGILFDILDTLNGFFECWRIQKKNLVEAFNDTEVIDLVLRNSDALAEYLEDQASMDSRFSAETNIWWLWSHSDYPKQKKWNILAQLVLVWWINKFIFAHILKDYISVAWKVDDINLDSSPIHALGVFEAICEEGDFWNVFKPQLWEQYVIEGAWDQILSLHSFMREITLWGIEQGLIQNLLENVLLSSKRKVAWQYATPMQLARLLVQFTVLNTRGIIYDPCCGTGTIIRAAYDIKKEKWMSPAEALRQVLASDKFSFPLQLATLSISEPVNMGKVLPFFKVDCTELKQGDTIELHDPNNGHAIFQSYEEVDYITSNLPFIQQEDLKELNPGLVERVNTQIEEESRHTLPSKSDIYAYLPFYFWRNIKSWGWLGIITSNSWLGVEWGQAFRELLSKYYKIETIAISWNGRWFQNAAVVTTILVLRKRDVILQPGVSLPDDEETNFVTLHEDISSSSNDQIGNISDHLLTGISFAWLGIQKHKTKFALDFSLNWTALFTDVAWIDAISSKLVPVTNFFEVERWERRGWDPMFFPESGHGIENEYIKPVLKSPRDIVSYVANAESEAFCCGDEIEDLRNSEKTWALNWIRRFEHDVNEKGKPLPIALKRSGCQWYEMKNTSLADLVASINYWDRLFIAKLHERSFVNQRLTRFTKKQTDLDIDLLHALLNSVIGIFFIEALWFGRWMGALDLSATRMKSLPVLNPHVLSQDQITNIKNAFFNIASREILPISEELEMTDRIQFDSVVLEAFGISEYKDQILKSFKMIYSMRKTSDTRIDE